MAISSYNSKLMIKESSAWEQLCSIKGIPQIGGEPNQIETTTLDDDTQTFIDGVKQQSTMSSTVNYDKTVFSKIKALEGSVHDLSIWLGNDGLGGDGKFTGKGKVSVYVNEADVDSAVEMTLTVTPTSSFNLETEA